MRRRRHASAVLLAAAALAAAVPAAAQAIRPSRAQGTIPNLDVRRAAAPAAAAAAPGAAAAQAALRRSLGRRASVEVDPATGTARSIARLGSTLTGPSRGDRLEIADRYAREHLDAIGLTPADLGTLGPAATVDGPGGVLYIRRPQVVDGIQLFEGDLRTVVDAAGRVVSVGGSPVHGLGSANTRPALSSGQALEIARVDARAPAGRAAQPARLVLYETGGGARLAWDVTVRASSQATYETLIDAVSGAILHRQNLVKTAAPALVWSRYPGAPSGGTQASIDLQANGWLGPSATTLNGPFAHAYSDLNDDDVANASEEISRSGGSFAFPFTDFTASDPAGACDPGHLCSWDFGVSGSWQTNRAQNAVQAFDYASAFHDHLLAPPIGFDAASGNFENGDKLNLETDDGAGLKSFPDVSHTDNANMLTPPDGQSPTMQMYLFFNAGDFRDINGGDDANIVYHEYTHGLSGRLITFGDGSEALNGDQPGAMGEAWSDWYAKDFLANQGLQVDTPAPGEVDMGDYTDSVPHQLRTQALDCPVGAPAAACPGSPTAGSGGYTYGDFGQICSCGPEVHADGEIWSETLWDIRTALGSPVSEALITGGMRGSPPEPTFLDERNAIINADVAIFGGHHVAALWRVFGARGMGIGASTGGPNDDHPVEAFASPPDQPPAGTLTATPSSVAPGGNVHFDASSFQDPDGTVREYRWDFDGNGTVDRVTATPATDFAYPAAGSYAATVTAVDDGGVAAQATATVAVSTPALVTLRGRPPSLRLTRARRSVVLTVTCASRCRVSAGLTVDKRTARRLRLGRSRSVGSLLKTLSPGTHRITLRLGTKALRALLRAHRHSLSAKLSVRVRDAQQQPALLSRTVTIRL